MTSSPRTHSNTEESLQQCILNSFLYLWNGRITMYADDTTLLHSSKPWGDN